GKRYLYAKLTQNPDLQDDYQEFASFLAFQAQTSVGQLFTVEQKIKEALQIPMTLETKLDIVKTNINQINELVIAVDSILDVSSNALELTDAKQQKQSYAEQLYQLDSLYDKLHGEYVTGMHLILQEVLTLNGLVTATMGYEQNEKTVNDITLNATLFQNGILTSDQINTLVSIAEECPKTGGHGVYRARGVLSDCQIEIWNDNSATCFPMPEPGEEKILNNNIAEQPNKYSTDKLLIFPNPAVDGFSVRVPPNNSGVLTLVDGLGKIQISTRFSEEEGFHYVELDNLPQGIYFCTIHQSNGEVQISKVFVVGN
ncbi:MAG: T9SS type A sorting domain-containing protein, partial [Saprospiraceae bacterium]|nr:T9SS type A sorting domain-containing protein [Saprospiraceae bacterium]